MRGAGAGGARFVRLLALGGVGLGVVAGLGGCEERGAAGASLSVAETLADTDTAGYARAVEPRAFSFPADHGPHPAFKHEWWYFTGNLEPAEGGAGEREAEAGDIGFQLTFFRSALRPDTAAPTVESDWATRQAFMGHFALTDVAGDGFYAFERFDRGALGLAGAEGEPMRVWIGDWEARERDGGFRVQASQEGVALDLVLTPTQPPVLQGDDGLSRKGPEPGNASYYYSLMRLEARGTVIVGGRDRRVAGTAWLDREWSTSALSPGLAGWDWFSIQLDDDAELMLYRLRQDDGGTAPFSAGTFVAPDGTLTRLGPDDFVLDETGSWTSPRGGRYPSGWRIRVPSLQLDLAVTPRRADQELDLAFRYWEGSVAVEGERTGRSVHGRGYVELTGYADSPRP